MKKYGCIGKKLSHSFSKEIHKRLAAYDYELIELEEDAVPSFMEGRDFAAINVTIPYKQTVMPYLDEMSDVARRIGAVNTVVNRDGRLYGYNTDYYGMRGLIDRMGLSLAGKRVMILGTGGTCRTAQVVAADLGASRILTVSRRAGDGAISYEEARALCDDVEILINTTPVGMYPDGEAMPMDPSIFPRLEGVIDAVYNPLRTNLVLAARERGIPAEGGLYMLVMQAVVAVEKFLDVRIDGATADRVFAEILAEKESIVLTGMPGSGKSTVGQILRERGYDLVDTDREIEARCGCSIRELIDRDGEKAFRDRETEVIRDVSAEGGRVIATGGGAILREENLLALRRNGRLFFLDAPLSRLRATADRPLSDTEDKLARLYEERIGRYRACADAVVPDLGSARAEADYILEKRREWTL